MAPRMFSGLPRSLSNTVKMLSAGGGSSTARPGSKVLEKKRSTRTKDRAKREVRKITSFNFVHRCPSHLDVFEILFCSSLIL